MIIGMQCIIRYGFFIPFNVEFTLSVLGFSFLVLATVLIAAGGYIINDIIDVTADKINKPKRRVIGVSIDLKRGKLLYYIFTFGGLGLGFVLSAMIQKPFYFLIFAGTAMALYLYSRFFRKIAIVGNIIVSITIALSIIIVGVFELFPIVDDYNSDIQMLIFGILIDFSLAAFLLNFIREIIKDVEDIQGDHVARYKTLPVILGAQRTARIASVIGLFSLTLISWYTFTYLYDQKVTVAVMFFGIIAPLGYVCTQLWEADKKSQFTKLSLILKIAMLIGICAIPLISYTLENAS